MHTNYTEACVFHLRLSAPCNIVAGNQARAICQPLSRQCANSKGQSIWHTGSTAGCRRFQRSSFLVVSGSPDSCAADQANSSSACVFCADTRGDQVACGFLPLPRTATTHFAVCPPALDLPGRSLGATKAAPASLTLQSCLTVRLAGGWPASRTELSRQIL
jgi:hypothetical protein